MGAHRGVIHTLPFPSLRQEVPHQISSCGYTAAKWGQSPRHPKHWKSQNLAHPESQARVNYNSQAIPRSDTTGYGRALPRKITEMIVKLIPDTGGRVLNIQGMQWP